MKKASLKKCLLVLAAVVVTGTAAVTGTVVMPFTVVTVNAAAPGVQEYASGATTEEEVIRRINEIVRIFPEGSYATTDNRECDHSSSKSCSKCSYHSVMTERLGINPISTNAWTCVGFRNLVYEYVFRDSCLTSRGNPEVIASGTLEQVIQEAFAGDVIKLGSHYAMVTVVNGQKYLYHANGYGKKGTSYVLLQPYRNYFSTSKNDAVLYRNSAYAEALRNPQTFTPIPEIEIPHQGERQEQQAPPVIDIPIPDERTDAQHDRTQEEEKQCWVGVPDGIYEIRSALDHYYALTIAENSSADGANAQLRGGACGYVHQFRVTHVGGGKYSIVNVASGKALDVEAGGKADEKNVRQYSENENTNQLWTFEYGELGGALIRNVGTGLYLDVDNAWTFNGSNVKAFVRNPLYAAQEWFFYMPDVSDRV